MSRVPVFSERISRFGLKLKSFGSKLGSEGEADVVTSTTVKDVVKDPRMKMKKMSTPVSWFLSWSIAPVDRESELALVSKREGPFKEIQSSALLFLKSATFIFFSSSVKNLRKKTFR